MNPPRKFFGQTEATVCATKYSLDIHLNDTTRRMYSYAVEVDAYKALYEALETEHTIRVHLQRHTQGAPGSPWYWVETVKDFWRGG